MDKKLKPLSKAIMWQDKRTINSIRYDIKGRMKSYKELKKNRVKTIRN